MPTRRTQSASPRFRQALGAWVVLCTALLAACQKAPEAAPEKAPAPAEAKPPPVILGGLQPGDTVTVTDCPATQPGVCVIGLTATAPAGGSGDACTVVMNAAVSVPRTTNTLRWQLTAGDANFNYRFREAAAGEPPGFGVHLIDNLMYVAASASAPASPMQPIWVPQQAQPQLVQMERVVRDWPPRISAYDVYLEYQAQGAKSWTPCKTWDPIVISRE
ncbi:hypothetical protein [Rubrivivax rivuli]|uniref:Uncharacterized protein n=1 Tax=Rubrivivax rivuli TaxID=1862385 RepID=A0A437R949_9BURK|nr:hypothetical protein [Rubrivivax rivuli]RVU43316.1 hypothetical protein EOE66_20425 [Rubrivivax rivuli]